MRNILILLFLMVFNFFTSCNGNSQHHDSDDLSDYDHDNANEYSEETEFIDEQNELEPDFDINDAPEVTDFDNSQIADDDFQISDDGDESDSIPDDDIEADSDFEAEADTDTDNEINDDSHYVDLAESLNESAEKGIEFLLGKQKANGAIRDDNYEIFDVWETINALLVFALWNDKISSESINTAFENGIEFLKTSENSEGLVLHTHKNADDFCVETSSEYLRLLLIVSERLALINNLDERIDYLKDMQKTDGSFNVNSSEILPENQNYPSVTGFAIRMLEKSGKTVNYHKEAFDFFCNKQNEDNTWGFNWQFYGTPFYAFEPILSVWDKADEEHLNCLEKSILYLKASLKESGEYDDNVISDGSSISSELKTALASYAMWHVADDEERENVLVSVSWLLSMQQNDGSWYGGLFPNPNVLIKKNEDIYATSVILIMFSEVHEWLLNRKITSISHKTLQYLLEI